ncbi:hypothetical protein U4E84_10755 [Halorubrum sp. AD140]|uniref:hypothetical protein n=1 Tax=Halorubrum sp. AD140 TaxID=3050073 RepID=UPI002ACC41CB|nr:hypothetical protein [Halorubrum sp. AD140]MDZ5811820.1 hypothetical protein [Halorubrum sp. AD140]
MTSREFHLTSCVPVAFIAVLLGHHPLIVVPLVVGALLPELDTVDERCHRSWLAHSLFLPAVAHWSLRQGDLLTPVVERSIHFVTVGLVLHLLADYVYPKGMDHQGSEWPVRPAFPAPYWGLFWMGLAWAFQWFWYLVPEFLPWLAGF